VCGLLTAASFPVVFVDEAARAGLTAIFICGDDERKNYIIETLGTGVALFDYNNDGLLDIFAVTASRLSGLSAGEEPTNRLFKNNGDGTFADVSKASGLARSGWGQGVCSADFDNDGNQDLFVTYYGRDILYRNKGNGSFEDITTVMGERSKAERWGTGCAFIDYNKDGKLDLFVANYVQFDQKSTPTPDSPKACSWKGDKVMCGPRGLKGGVNRLFRNDSSGNVVRFTDVSGPSGIEAPGERYSLSVTTLDFDNDDRPDIYVAVDSQASLLFRNNGNGTFSDVAVEAGVAYSEDGREQAGMGSAATDFDGDGRADLAKTNFSDDTPNLYRNNGDGTFTEATFQAGLGIHSQFLGWGVAFLDYDRDTWPDIFMVNGHVYPGHKNVTYRQRRILYRNLGGGRFKDVSSEAGPAVMAQTSARGLAVGDYDNDGSVDLVITNMNDRLSLLRNTVATANNGVTLRLIGTKSNRDGIGAKVRVRVGSRVLVQEVRSGSTFMSQSDMRQHFGLGASRSADAIDIDGPSGAKERIGATAGGRIVTITEGRGITGSSSYKGVEP
jgi:hypothetical protein